MFHIVEKYRTPAQIILGVICLSFVFAGGYSLAVPGTDYISKVGDIKIKVSDVNDFQRRLQNASGNPVSKQLVYDTLVDQAYIQQGAQDMSINVSLEQIKQIIASEPSFQENGKFVETKYRAFLQQAGMSEEALIDDIRKQYAMQTMLNLMKAGNLVSDVQAKQMVNLLQSARQLQTVTFPAANFVNQVAIDDNKLKAHYEANKKQYYQPQAVKYEFVQLSAAELGAKENVSAEELKEAYDKIPASASAPKPSLEDVKAQLTQEIQARKGTALVAKMKESITDLAFNNPTTLQPIKDKLGLEIHKVDQGWVTREMASASGMPKALEDVLFGNDVLVKRYNSEPVDMGNGTYWVVRALDVRKEHQASFAEVKAQVKQDYVALETKNLAIAAAKQAIDAINKGNSPTLSWSPSTDLTPQQAVAVMSKDDFQSWIKAKPANGKSAYILLSDQQNPVLVKINSIKPPQDLVNVLPQAKQVISRNLAQNLVTLNLEWMKSRYKLKQGVQKLETGDEQ
ncbi:MAG: SurA N-terminal domain-containing protein [Snodgrassella sp.]|uniref:peptidylprolyl isomerase n=1 Tax=Snodgrassella TaxID=1193515 RepID=UPI0008158C49|nr:MULTISPECIES: peptidylprolyl isomerase [Snodgrassella]MCO6518223.1 SurA N-terminal domain-containing protein [Snodgrassella sp.]MCO6522540.1 SurA N-terminal domain-containing protein [Snodgrassella sp.]SCB73047.1 peptidyl-prolyl cis-trans isomerase D [Snodgrassella sp. R-53583]